jgi:hypothetical protein
VQPEANTAYPLNTAALRKLPSALRGTSSILVCRMIATMTP